MPVWEALESPPIVVPYAFGTQSDVAVVIAEAIWVAAPPYMLFAVKSAHWRSKLHTTGVANVDSAFVNVPVIVACLASSADCNPFVLAMVRSPSPIVACLPESRASVSDFV